MFQRLAKIWNFRNLTRSITYHRSTMFRSRFLIDDGEVFNHNAWDNVEWDDEHWKETLQAIKNNSEDKVAEEHQRMYDAKAAHFWDEFYQRHGCAFFKDRKWLFTEFPELVVADKGDAKEPVRMLECGCGVGNSLFVILDRNKDQNVFVYGCDYSTTAIKSLKAQPVYDPTRCEAFVNDLTSIPWTCPFPPASLDVITFIFALSAIHPNDHAKVLCEATRHLKPGGLILFRDHGHADLAQMRFKPGQCLQDNFYVRKDGTRAYFFNEQEVHNLLATCGLDKEQLLVDRRLNVNRAKKLKMYRMFVQAKYRKPLENKG